MQRVYSCLWFEKSAEEAMNYYVDSFNAVFQNDKSKIVSIDYYPENVDEEHMKGMEGKVINGVFELEGVKHICLDGGPLFKLNEAISICVEVDSQEQLDGLWEKLSFVPEAEQCGWCKDKYGLSWQIIPKRLGELMSDPDKEKTGRVMQALLKMHKLDISELEKAYDG